MSAYRANNFEQRLSCYGKRSPPRLGQLVRHIITRRARGTMNDFSALTFHRTRVRATTLL